MTFLAVRVFSDQQTSKSWPFRPPAAEVSLEVTLGRFDPKDKICKPRAVSFIRNCLPGDHHCQFILTLYVTQLAENWQFDKVRGNNSISWLIGHLGFCPVLASDSTVSEQWASCCCGMIDRLQEIFEVDCLMVDRSAIRCDRVPLSCCSNSSS